MWGIIEKDSQENATVNELQTNSLMLLLCDNGEIKVAKSVKLLFITLKLTLNAIIASFLSDLS